MMRFESVTIRTAKNGFTVEPSLPLGPIDIGPSSAATKDTYKQRAEAQRPRVATSVEDALSMAAELLGTPCDVSPQIDSARGYDEKDSAMTSDPSEMF